MIRDMLKKQPAYKNPALSKSAKGQPCTLQFPGICDGGGLTTVLAHEPSADNNGKAYKTDDFDACFACHPCHDELDGRSDRLKLTYLQKTEYFHVAMVRTLRYWFTEGLLK